MSKTGGVALGRIINKNRVALPVLFLNREGESEIAGCSGSSTTSGADVLPFTSRSELGYGQQSLLLPHELASNRLRRALFETGQLCVTTRDGLARVCFAGMGDPERLFVEVVPREVEVPALDCHFPGCLCSLLQAEKLLLRIYRGESTRRLEAGLDRLAEERRKQRQRAPSVAA